MHIHEVVPQLRRRLGLGERPHVRLRFYQRLAACADRDPVVLEIISQTLVEAADKKSPDRWFCRSVRLRLEECGLAGALAASVARGLAADLAAEKGYDVGTNGVPRGNGRAGQGGSSHGR